MAKKYNVYGVGNALVDLEYEVKPADLELLGIDKGVMTLVDDLQQQRIMLYLAAHPQRRSAGGSAANSMMAISQLGGRSFYSCKVADDELGRFYLEDLRTGGVDTSCHLSQQGSTGRCLVLVTPEGDRTLCTFLGISGNLSRNELVEGALRDSSCFYMEGYLATSETARQACVEARCLAEAAGVKTALSLSDLNIVRFFREGLLEMIGPGVDLLFANENEACGMAGKTDVREAGEYLKTLSREWVLTRGAQGALIWDGQAIVEIDAVKVTAVDTVGAGDLFAGAFLYGRSQGWEHRRAGELAAAAAARLVTRFGPRLSLEEIRAVVGAFQ